MNYPPEHNGHTPSQEVFSENNEETETKEELQRRLQEISQMKFDTQEEIGRLRSALESTTRTAESLEAEEKEIEQRLQQLQ